MSHRRREPTAAETPTARPPVRFDEGAVSTLLPAVIALLVALVIGDLLIIAYGESPVRVYALLLEGTWGNWYGFGQVLFKATTLTCTGLAFALAARAGLFNIGAEGQLAAGGFAAAITGLMLPPEVPGVVAVVLCIAAAMAGGALVGATAGILRARFGASEVIVTIMLNFIVAALLNYLLVAHFAVPETIHTPAIVNGLIPTLSGLIPVFHGSAVNWSTVLVIVAAFLTWWYLFRSVDGYEMRATGLQPEAARYGGIRVHRVMVIAMLISGALAALGGVNYVLGYRGYYEDGFAIGSGFLGIAVALTGRNHPIGILLAALFFATLSQGGLAVNALVPKQLMDILQAVVILVVAAASPEIQRQLRKAAQMRAFYPQSSARGSV